jgi:hypothetical protein
MTNGNGLDAVERLANELAQQASELVRPAMSAAFRESLLSIPARTVSCEAAANLIAAAVETDLAGDALSASDRSRLDFHLGRCEGCREAHDTLAGISELVEPAPAPWFPGRLTAARPARRRTGWRGLLDPRTAIGFAYGSALIVMLAGFNPADLARKASSNLKLESQTATTKASEASGSLADRVGALEDRVSRRLAVVRGRVGGYSRAMLSNAMSLVMKTEREPAPPPSRPRNGEERAIPRSETAIPTWRA